MLIDNSALWHAGLGPPPVKKKLFRGKSALAESRSRFYDPYIGRFLSEDRIGFHGGDVNFYRYVNNVPVSFTDPLGQGATTTEYKQTHYFLYMKVDRNGRLLKIGMTKNWCTRYSKVKLAGGRLIMLAKSTDKYLILLLERTAHKIAPLGPEEGSWRYLRYQMNNFPKNNPWAPKFFGCPLIF